MSSGSAFSATLAVEMSRPGLPYLFQGDLERGLGSVSAIGYRGIELLLPGCEFISSGKLGEALDRYDLKLAAIGTGGAFISERLHLCSEDAEIRQRAEEYVLKTIDLAAPFGAVVIIGLVTGFLEGCVTRGEALGWLVPALRRLGAHADRQRVRVVVEPLNRYEGNLINRIDDGLDLLGLVRSDHIGLLADLFHMNIEEADMAGAIRRAGDAIGHVHFVDSNRRSPGMGHSDLGPILEALDDIGYGGFLSVEALPIPDPETAARAGLEAMVQHFSGRVRLGHKEDL